MEREDKRFDAWVSGTAEVAIVYPVGSKDSTKTDPIGIVRAETPDTLELVTRGVFEAMRNHWFGRTTDWVVYRKVTLAEIKAALELEEGLIEALALATMILESGTDDDIRQEAGKELEDCFEAIAGVEERLRNILWSLPTPESPDWTKALAVTQQGQTPKAAKLYEQLAQQQPAIEAVHRTWNSIPTSVFGGEQSRQEFRVTMVRLGVFRRLVEGEDFQTVFNELETNPEANELLNFKLVMLDWQRAIEG